MAHLSTEPCHIQSSKQCAGQAAPKPHTCTHVHTRVLQYKKTHHDCSALPTPHTTNTHSYSTQGWCKRCCSTAHYGAPCSSTCTTHPPAKEHTAPNNTQSQSCKTLKGPCSGWFSLSGRKPRRGRFKGVDIIRFVDPWHAPSVHRIRAFPNAGRQPDRPGRAPCDQGAALQSLQQQAGACLQNVICCPRRTRCQPNSSSP